MYIYWDAITDEIGIAIYTYIYIYTYTYTSSSVQPEDGSKKPKYVAEAINS